MKRLAYVVVMICWAFPALAQQVIQANPSQASDTVKEKMRNIPPPIDTGCPNGLSVKSYPDCTIPPIDSGEKK